MIGIDTNILLRYLIEDDPAQAHKAARFIETAKAKGERMLINVIVLCECSWVLGSVYKYSRETISDIVEKILITSQFEVEDKPAIRRALDRFKQSAADLSDCIIVERNLSLGCGTTASFDKKFKSLDQTVL